ncbi:uncharacterized protein LOC133530230 isoform X2 [Cydia pomonella]|uniref:uncharacterized protein LOC133530230 isoform X2 n=1 Tax=Cydia pomonella TaxID=82600 RepID=UPI002ADDC864|nr:uncharacterized protein LOC133530230 isoform X2 [Cydia pomonella]
MLVALALALLSAVSAFDPSLSFHYVKYPRVFRRNEVACQVCYGEFDCLSMDRCGYSAAVTDVLEEVDGMKIVNDGLKTKMDSMMYDLLLEDSLKEYNKCIPLISSYTTCNKENICLGCKSCDCDESGHWNCSETSKCSNLHLDIDHRIITSVVESLNDVKPSRYKRSYEGSEESSTRSMFDDLIDWMGVSKPNDVKVINGITPRSTTIVTATASTKNHTTDDMNTLVFDDILSNDNLEDFIKYSGNDMNYGRKYENNDSNQFLKMLRNIEEGRDDKSPVDNPRLNIKLLKDLKKYIREKSYVNEPSNDQPNSINAILTDIDDIDPDKQPSDINSVAVVLKRNVRDVNETSIGNRTKTIENQKTKTRNATPSFDIRKINVTYSEKEIQHIIDVVTVLIGNERKEINHLNYVRENLLKLLKKYQTNSSVPDIIHKQNSDDNANKNGNWRVDMLNFYMSNLKRDVKDTLRDIYAIIKLKKLGVNSVAERVSNLKPLLFALTSYYMKNFRDYRQTEHAKNYSNIDNRFIINNTPSIDISSIHKMYDSEPKPQRRVFQPSTSNVYQIKLIKRALTRMLVMIDNDRLSTNALSPLSSKIKDILKRLVNKQYVKGFADTHPSIRDPNFNLTKLLTSLVEEWQNMSVDMHTLNPSDHLYHMKLLHLSLSQGIDKIKDALVCIQFGYSRRMSFIEEYVGKNLIADISKYLTSIDQRIQNFAINTIVTKALVPKRRDEQTGSLWHHIKNAFSNSKHDFLKYVQGKMKPKSYIVNDKVRKRAEEVNKQKFLEVMKKWQHNFDAYRVRNKRSIKQYTKRLKNIIPKYLRGIKANKALNAKFNENKRIQVRNKGPVIYQTTTHRQYRKYYTLPPAKHHGSGMHIQRHPTGTTRPHLKVRTTNRPGTTRKGQKKVGKTFIQQHPTLRPQKGNPKKGVRTQHV